MFSDHFGKVTKNCIFDEEGYFVWCGSMTKWQENYYLVYSRWKREYGFDAWVTDSEICLAKCDRPDGQFHYLKTLKAKDNSGKWDSSCAHNPTILFMRGKYYLYYTGNNGNGAYWDNRNKQRIGVAVCDNPEGEWTFYDKPVIDITVGAIDSLMVSNPAVTETPDGRILMIYKAVDDKGTLPVGGPVICGAAFASDPLGPFQKTGKPLFVNPEDNWSVEDPFVWYENGQYHAICSDFHGYFTGVGSRSLAMFISNNGIDWIPDKEPLAFRLEYPSVERGNVKVFRLERPQIFFENGKKRMIVCACAEDDKYQKVYSVRIPLKSGQDDR